MKSKSIRLIALFLCAAMGVSLYGCRYSPVLEQIIYDTTKTDEIEDQYFYPLDNVENTENDTEELVPIEEDETDRTRDEVMNLPTGDEEDADSGTQLSYNEDATNSDVSTKQQYSTAAESKIEGSGTTSSSMKSTTKGVGNSNRGDTLIPDGISNGQGTDGTEHTKKSNQDGSEQSGYGEEGKGEEEPVKGESGQSIDPTSPSPSAPDINSGGNSSGEGAPSEGGHSDPLELASVKTVAAVGSTALMVMMLTGNEDNTESALVATNADLYYDASVREVFPCLVNTECTWEDDGTQAPYSNQLSALLELQPDAVVYVETSTIGSGTAYSELVSMYEELYGTTDGHLVALEDMTTSQDAVKDNMAILTEMLKEAYPEAEGRLEAYNDWSERAETAAQTGIGETVYTLYVDGWDPYVEYTRTVNGIQAYSGTGSAYLSSKGTSLGRSVITYMGLGGVKDVIDFGDSGAHIGYYVPVGVYQTETNGGGWNAVNSSLGVNFFCNAWPSMQYTEEGFYGRSTTTSDRSPGLGAGTFTTVIAGDAATKDNIKKEKQTPTENGIGASWAVYGSASGYTTGEPAGDGGGLPVNHGFVSETNILMESYIYGDYNVWVNPCGLVSDWVSGGPESILESVWAAYKIRGAVDLGTVRDYVNEFYSTLCRYPITSEQIDNILMIDENMTG